MLWWEEVWREFDWWIRSGQHGKCGKPQNVCGHGNKGCHHGGRGQGWDGCRGNGSRRGAAMSQKSSKKDRDPNWKRLSNNTLVNPNSNANQNSNTANTLRWVVKPQMQRHHSNIFSYFSCLWLLKTLQYKQIFIIGIFESSQINSYQLLKIPTFKKFWPFWQWW